MKSWARRGIMVQKDYSMKSEKNQIDKASAYIKIAFLKHRLSDYGGGVQKQPGWVNELSSV